MRFETVLVFGKTLRPPITTTQVIHNKLGGEATSKNTLRKDVGTLIRKEKEKHAIRWDYDSCNILYEDNTDHTYCIKDTVDAIEKINQVLPINTLSSINLKTYWILPINGYSFKSLEIKYRDNFIRQSPIFENCVDSTIVIDMEWSDRIISHQSGAMDIAQLQDQYRVFKAREDYPALFLFLSISITNKKLLKYCDEAVGEFLTSSFDKSKTHSDGFERIMRSIL